MKAAPKRLKIVCMSDSHEHHRRVHIPPCDLLIHSGDATNVGRKERLEDFAQWADAQPATEIVFVPGNHEIKFSYDRNSNLSWLKAHCPRMHVLVNQSVELFGLKIYGTPYTPAFGSGFAFQLMTKEDEERVYSAIPNGSDIVVCHGPCADILDEVWSGNAGSVALRNRIMEVMPKLFVSGHIHTGYGMLALCDTLFVNAALCTDFNELTNQVISLTLDVT